MRTEWLRSYLPDNLTRGAGRSLWVQTDVLQCQLTKHLRTRRFAVEKWMPCIPCLTAFVILPPFCMFSKHSIVNSIKKRWEGLVERLSFLHPLCLPFILFTTFSISLCPHRTPPNEGALCSPQNLRGCCPCRPICARWSWHTPVFLGSDRLPFGCSVLLE